MSSWIVESPLPLEGVLERLRERSDENTPRVFAPRTKDFLSTVDADGFRVCPQPEVSGRACAPLAVGRLTTTTRGTTIELRLRPVVESFATLLRKYLVPLSTLPFLLKWLVVPMFRSPTDRGVLIASGWALGLAIVFAVPIVLDIREYRRRAEKLLTFVGEVFACDRKGWTPGLHVRPVPTVERGQS